MDVEQRATGRPDPETAAEAGARCWCGGTDLEPLGSDYLCCAGCGTVVYGRSVELAEYPAGDGTGFYGDHYWRRHVPGVLGLPGLEERARADLPERAVFHLVRILERLAPGHRLLELGCGAGSLTYLLGQAGFDACGLELGPAAIEVARERFDVEVHRGPLEARRDLDGYDAIVAVDVLEHLPRPLETMTLCARRLVPGGLLFLQTPCYRGEGAEWRMLLPGEHLHLFTAASVERLLRAAGFAAVEVGASLFSHDMWVIAAIDDAPAERPDPLAGVPPMAVALIDAYAERVRADGERDAVDADRRQKEAVNVSLRGELESVRGDQAAKEELLRRQDRELSRIRDDQRAKGELIARLDADVAAVRGDQAAKEELIGRLTSDLDAVRGDRAAKEELIGRLTSDLDAVRGDRAAKEELIDRLSSDLAATREDQAAKAALIDRMSSELESVRADQRAKEDVIRRLDAELAATRAERAVVRAELAAARAELDAIHADRVYRVLRAARARLGGRR